jgi:hypothetical protein
MLEGGVEAFVEGVCSSLVANFNLDEAVPLSWEVLE